MPACAAMACRLQGEPGFSLHPEEEKCEGGNAEEHGLEDSITGDELMEDENVDEDGTETEQAEIARFRHPDEDAAEELDHFDEGHVAGRSEGGEEARCRRAHRNLWHGSESEEDDAGGHNEEESEEGSSNDGRN